MKLGVRFRSWERRNPFPLSVLYRSPATEITSRVNSDHVKKIRENENNFSVFPPENYNIFFPRKLEAKSEIMKRVDFDREKKDNFFRIRLISTKLPLGNIL